LAEGGARLAIRLLQDAAERGEIDPWDVDVIAVIDGFLDQLRQRILLPRLIPSGSGGSYERDLAESSEALLAASVLVSLKAEMLEASTLAPEAEIEEHCDSEPAADSLWPSPAAIGMLSRPERHLWRRPVAPPPLQRPVSLGELIQQLETIAEQLEHQEQRSNRPSQRSKRYSDRTAIEQVAALAHREKLPETTAALGVFLRQWEPAGDWAGFDALVQAWGAATSSGRVDPDLDADRVGVFWALLFLCHQGKVELSQAGGLFAPLLLRRLPQQQGWDGRCAGPGPDLVPALQRRAA